MVQPWPFAIIITKTILRILVATEDLIFRCDEMMVTPCVRCEYFSGQFQFENANRTLPIRISQCGFWCFSDDYNEWNDFWLLLRVACIAIQQYPQLWHCFLQILLLWWRTSTHDWKIYSATAAATVVGMCIMDIFCFVFVVFVAAVSNVICYLASIRSCFRHRILIVHVRFVRS